MPELSSFHFNRHGKPLKQKYCRIIELIMINESGIDNIKVDFVDANARERLISHFILLQFLFQKRNGSAWLENT